MDKRTAAALERVREEVDIVGGADAYAAAQVAGNDLVLVLAELDRLCAIERRAEALRARWIDHPDQSGWLVNAEASAELDRLRAIEYRAREVLAGRGHHVAAARLAVVYILQGDQ